MAGHQAGRRAAWPCRYVPVAVRGVWIVCDLWWCVDVGEVIQRFEKKGYKLVALKLLTPTKAKAEAHCE